jgi:Uma2 family endonuclease
LGRTFAAETGFLLKRNPDTVRAPDFAFIASTNLPASDPAEAFWPGAPDLAIEVVSPGDSTSEVTEKVDDWFAAGCVSVWVVDPKLKTVTIHRTLTDFEIRTIGEVLVGDPVVPGFSRPVDELFR